MECHVDVTLLKIKMVFYSINVAYFTWLSAHIINWSIELLESIFVSSGSGSKVLSIVILQTIYFAQQLRYV